MDPVFKSGTDLYNNDLDNEADTVAFYNCSTLGYDATYNIPNIDTSLTVSAALDTTHELQPAASLAFATHSVHMGLAADSVYMLGLHV